MFVEVIPLGKRNKTSKSSVQTKFALVSWSPLLTGKRSRIFGGIQNREIVTNTDLNFPELLTVTDIDANFNLLELDR